MKETNKESLGNKRKTLPKEKVKGLFEKNTPGNSWTQQCTPQTNHTIVYQGCSWTTPLKNCLSDVFHWVLIRCHIFWEIGHF